MQRLFSSALQTELLALHTLMTSANEDLLQVAREHQRRIGGHRFLICGEKVKIQRRYRKETDALLTIQDNSEDTRRTVRKTAHLDPHLTVEDLAGVVLLGSLRIDSPWLSGFEPARPKPFKRLDGSVTEVPMMRQHAEVEIYQNRKTTAVRKQLQDSTQVEFMMGPVPDHEISYRPQNIRLRLPRFSIDQIHDRRFASGSESTLRRKEAGQLSKRIATIIGATVNHPRTSRSSSTAPFISEFQGQAWSLRKDATMVCKKLLICISREMQMLLTLNRHPSL